MNYYRQHQSDFLEGLKTFLRIPSISTFSEHKPDIRRAAEFALNELRAAGMTSAELIEGEGNPLVYAEWLGAPGKPTILFYGHYDVQPPDPLDEWKSPPFEPEVRGNDIFARGACDDKGQVYIQIKAVEGLLKTTGKLPVNVKFLLEGEEETGGEHIEAYVKTKPPRLKADAAVVCDTEMFAPELPTICVGLRGMVYYELFVQGADHDLHSGVYGGAAPNPILAISEILCALKDRDGHIQIPGFYDRVSAQRQGARRLGRACPSTSRSTPRRRWAPRNWWANPKCRCSSACGRGPRWKCTASAAASRGRRQDRDPRPRRRQDQHAPGGRPARRRIRRAIQSGGGGGLSQRGDGGSEDAPLRRALADQPR
jgi:acetylornithine deacetylase/succinyl-diaminopimelate desuccinylase-like protein